MERRRAASRRRLDDDVDYQPSERSTKRRRLQTAAAPAVEQQDVEFTLYVRWYGSGAGQTKVTALPLRSVAGVDALPELGKELVAKAYEHAARPDFLASPDYARFTPARECLAVPGDIVRTELRLVLAHGGWEYCVLKRALTASAPADSDMLVTAIEFEGRPEEAILGALGLRVSLIAYPIVALRKSFLEGVTARLCADPGSFQGLL